MKVDKREGEEKWKHSHCRLPSDSKDQDKLFKSDRPDFESSSLNNYILFSKRLEEYNLVSWTT